MEQNISIGIGDTNRKQKIAFDVNVFKELLSNANKDINYFYLELPKVISQIQDYHNLTCNLKWLSDVELLKTLNIDYNILNQFYQLLLRNDKIKFYNINDMDNSDEYVYKMANVLPQKILVSNKNQDVAYKLNIYNEQQFVSKDYKNNCVLYRLPKILRYTSGDILNDFNFMGFYFNDCTLVEFIDSYLLKPNYNSSLDLILSFLGQIKEGTNVRFHYDIANSKDFEYNLFCNDIKDAYPFLKLCKPKQKNGKYHDRFIIIDENKYSMTFTASFNNIEKKINVFEVNKSFEIIIEEGRLYLS